MFNKRRKLTIGLTAAAITLVVAAVLVIAFPPRPTLTLTDADTGRLYAAYAVDDGEEFSVEFIHSVNQSPVRDVYLVSGREIAALRTVYSAFGAGVQSELEPGQTLSYDEDGNMVVSGFDYRWRKLRYIVGTVSDHLLMLDGREISLRSLCGRNANVVFEIKYISRIFLKEG